MFVSKFRPIDARRALYVFIIYWISFDYIINLFYLFSPLFDEPGIKATYDITIYHRPDFVAVSNTPVKVFKSFINDNKW